ncbi:MAG: hypothetical protein JWR85_3641 [Marmoricola sp.]|nr:hypothetical protein [Marmoricola sp.]
MLQQIKSEFQKLLTIRSTYILLASAVAIMAFISFYVMGYRGALPLNDSRTLAGVMVIIVTNLALLVSLIGVLSVTHEYRYNTIMYTLTASNSRLKVFFAKLVVVSVFTVIVTLALAVLSAVLTYLGAEAKGVTIVPQNIPVWDLLWRIVLFGWGYSMLALIFAFVIRRQVGTIVALIFLPDISGGLLGLLLKENAVYLPFSALNSVLNPSPITYTKAALVVAIYLVVGGAIAAYVFKRRDAN